MALIKEVQTPIGVPGNYWTIYSIEFSKFKKTCKATVVCYVNKATREAGNLPASGKSYDFNGTEFTFDITGNLTAQVYVKLKALPDFAGATDDI